MNRMCFMVFSCRNKAWYVKNILSVCVRGSLVHCIYFCCLGNCHIAYHLYSTAFEHDVESSHIFRCAGPRPIRQVQT